MKKDDINFCIDIIHKNINIFMYFIKSLDKKEGLNPLVGILPHCGKLQINVYFSHGK
jgi:hypothetical protein